MGMQRRSLLSRLKSGFDRWRLVFLVFIVVYVSFLLLDLGYTAIQWDETNHLNGGLLLLHGHLRHYVEHGMFYPPLDDVILAGYFSIGGASVFTGRLAAVTFAVLSVVLVFEFAYRTYGPKTAVISGILLATMPGFVWLSRLAMLETMLIFFFSASMMLFFTWMRNHENKYLALSGIALGLGFLTKYQIVIAVIAMVASVFLLCRGYMKTKLAKFPLLILVAVIVVLPWIVISHQVYSMGMLDQWIYALEIGNPQKLMYSMRFPAPIFYLIEMTWPYGVVHPISLFIYVFGLLGLGLLLWRRKPEDKFLLVWFSVVYIFFTLIGNKQWRYVVPIFPVLAISAASLMTFAYGKVGKTWKQAGPSLNRKCVGKVAAGFLVAIAAFSVVYSCVDAYHWVVKDAAFNLPSEQATNYVAERLNGNESIVVLCALNVFSQDSVKFYLHSSRSGLSYVGQYPAVPVDTYTPNFNVDELIGLCEKCNVKYLLLFEYGETYPYFNSTLTMQAVYQMLLDSRKFTFQNSFGGYPCRIFVLSFIYMQN